VFGFNLNFDPALYPTTVEEEAAESGDLEEYDAYRKLARVWLSSDYQAAIESSKSRKAKTTKLKTAAFQKGLEHDIAARYEQVQAREDVEAEGAHGEAALPGNGVQIKDQNTMHGHFHLLATLLQNADKVRCYMDQDSGMRAAFLCAFAERVKQRTTDAWFVSVMKDATVNQKEAAVKLSQSPTGRGCRGASRLCPCRGEDAFNERGNG